MSDRRFSVGRRRLLQSVGVGLASSVGLSTSSNSVTAQERSPIEFEQQESDGESLVIARVSVDSARTVMIQDKTDSNNTIFATKEISAGTDERDFTVELDQPIPETQVIQVWLWAGKVRQSDVITVQEALVAVGEELDATLGKTFIEADPDAGFNYPYYLFSPTSSRDGEIPLLVEPNNTGTVSDDFEQHRARAEQTVTRGSSRPISETLGVPLLVPVFPRPAREPVDSNTYTHQLDRDTLEIEGNDLERIDLQLLRMVEDAKNRLAGEEYTFTDQVILNGFSASGNFVDRFTVLHPDRVLSVTAGGLNGMTLLPLEEMNGYTLDYHVGIADLKALTGEPVDLSQLNEVNQLLYMGSEDENDTIPYSDAWSPQLRELALNVYGEDMIEERFPQCQTAYNQAGVQAQFKIYDGTGHRPAEKKDLIEFHRRSINGEDISDFGDRLGVLADIGINTSPQRAGEAIEFDASGSKPNTGTLMNYSWEFGDGQTAAGEVVSHAYNEAGTYNVTLSVVSDQGTTKETTREIVVETASTDPQGEPSQPDSGQSDDEPASNMDPASDDTVSAVTALFTVEPKQPTAGEEVLLDAGGSRSESGGFATIEWDLDDGTTASGGTTTHVFSEPGTYQVTLSVTSDQGETAETVKLVTVSETGTGRTNGSATETAGESGPGFGIGATLTGIGGAAYVLKDRFANRKDNQ